MREPSPGRITDRLLSLSALLALVLAGVSVVLAVHQRQIRRTLARAETLNGVLRQQLLHASEQMADLGGTMARLREQMESKPAPAASSLPWGEWERALARAEAALEKLPLVMVPGGGPAHPFLMDAGHERLAKLISDLGAARMQVRVLPDECAAFADTPRGRELIQTLAGLQLRLAVERDALLRRLLVRVGGNEAGSKDAVSVARAACDVTSGGPVGPESTKTQPPRAPAAVENDLVPR